MPEIKLLSYKEKAKEMNVQPITVIRQMKQNKLVWCKVETSKRKWFMPKYLDFLVDKAHLIEELKNI